jgi:hypothetical protein
LSARVRILPFGTGCSTESNAENGRDWNSNESTNETAAKEYQLSQENSSGILPCNHSLAAASPRTCGLGC